jgi:hypothetical protein
MFVEMCGLPFMPVPFQLPLQSNPCRRSALPIPGRTGAIDAPFVASVVPSLRDQMPDAGLWVCAVCTAVRAIWAGGAGPEDVG